MLRSTQAHALQLLNVCATTRVSVHHNKRSHMIQLSLSATEKKKAIQMIPSKDHSFTTKVLLDTLDSSAFKFLFSQLFLSTKQRLSKVPGQKWWPSGPCHHWMALQHEWAVCALNIQSSGRPSSFSTAEMIKPCIFKFYCSSKENIFSNLVFP